MTVIQRICFAIILAVFLPLTSFVKQSNVREFQQAEAAFQKYDFMIAERNYQLALIKFPDMGNLTAYIKNQLAYCKRYQGQIEESVAAYEKVRKEHPDSPQAGNVQENIARTYYEAGNYAKAGPAFEKLAQDLETEEVEARSISASLTSSRM